MTCPTTTNATHASHGMTNADTRMVPPRSVTAEIVAYGAAATRGDVLPVCLRLATARSDADWETRRALVAAVGPQCREDALDRAVSFMPNATEPRLLRAARAIAIADRVACPATRDAWLAYACRDLHHAARLDAMDATSRAMLADLVGATAWSYARPCRHAA